jgi:hypothetical protein
VSPTFSRNGQIDLADLGAAPSAMFRPSSRPCDQR